MVTSTDLQTVFSWHMDTPVYVVDYAVEAPIIVATGATWVSLQFLVDNERPAPGPALDDLNVIDAWVLHRWDPKAGTASDVATYGLGGAALLTTGLLGKRHGGLAPAVILVEAWTCTGLTVEVLKQATDRSRPFVRYNDPTDDIIKAQQNHDATMSFPSGHTAFAAAATFTVARMLDDVDAVPAWVAYSSAGALTTTVGVLRVLAGKHYPTDVVIGALIGGTYGLVLPVLHHQDRAVSLRVAGPREVAVVVTW
ncbi:MAG: phosphatase PAP2 family protein [Myxococcota bacterium]